MDNNIAPGANNSGMSRKNFLSSLGVAGAAVVAVGQAAAKSSDVNAMNGSNVFESACLSLSFTGTADELGNMVFPHGLGATLPANILSASAFIRLPDGKVRNISVQYVDDKSISIAGGVPNAAVKVGVVYSTDGTSW